MMQEAEMQTETDSHGCSPEANLWLAVLEEAITSQPDERALRWLQSDDGRMVASLAGLDPEWVSEKIVPAIGRSARTRRYRALQFTGRSRGQAWQRGEIHPPAFAWEVRRAAR